MEEMSISRSIRDHKVLNKVNKNGDQVYAIQFVDEPYKGIIFSFDKVELIPNMENDHLTIKFEYEIHREPVELYIKSDLENEIGDFLTLKIAEQLQDQELIYRGGLDEMPRPERD